MSSTASTTLPPDQAARERALEASRSVLVQAPAGSGKTDLLTRRFLRLLGEVDEPGQIVAITFTKAAAAEMRHRILAELEKAEACEHSETDVDLDEFSMQALAQRSLARSKELGWNLIDLPSQLRISTIDSFCRDLALQQPLLSGLGGGLDIAENSKELYRRAAQRTLEQIDGEGAELREAIASLLLLRDNGWQEMEELLVKMLEQRDKWMHDFVVGPEPDWDALRERLERSFARAVKEQLLKLNALLDRVPHARAEAMELARFACGQMEGALHRELAEIVEFPIAPFETSDQLEEAQVAFGCFAGLLLTKDGGFRKRIDKNLGFPADRKAEKVRLTKLIEDLCAVPGLETALAAVCDLPPLRYSDEDWRIVRSSFALLRQAAAQLKVVFAEAGVVDYVEVAQIAQAVLKGEGGVPEDAAQAVADGIHHLLVDEFQDTSRRQHQLVRDLIGAWPERERRTCFVVGDPMQSIYSFRDADAELFQRVKDIGLEIPHDQPLKFNSVNLTSNFRTVPGLVGECNEMFGKIFAEDDGSGVEFTCTEPARKSDKGLHLVVDEESPFKLHLGFVPAAKRSGNSIEVHEQKKSRERAASAQIDEIVALISSHRMQVKAAGSEGGKYRIAVLARARKSLVSVAAALREASIPFRAIELEKLKEQQEILDVLSLARALLNPQDRVAWLGVLRAPWCGLSLADLHALTSADNKELIGRPVPELLAERQALMSREGRLAVQRVLLAMESVNSLRFSQPAASLGTWLNQVWLWLGGDDCVDRAARANIHLLWQCLDSLPEGEQDLLGPSLGAALEKLTGLPDPDADEECGVQLMTIHKAKGLEFEVVIVPDLQAGTRGGKYELLSWLERGLTEPDDSGEVTEFLVAPLQAKGADRSGTRKWVDQVRSERERQEERRILYVAATRAREELHLFARLACKIDKNGEWTLAEPKNNLLAAAWPAIEEEAQRQFEEWSIAQRSAEQGSLDSVAASGGNETLGAIKTTVLRRLPPQYKVATRNAGTQTAESIVGAGAAELFERHEGGVLSRALGTAVHAMLQELARIRETLDWKEACACLSRLQTRTIAQIRAAGIDPAQAGRTAAQALEIAINVAGDPMGQWILSPHMQAASEARWAGVVEGALRTVQVDRVFKAGTAPLSEGSDAWWIIDYKTSQVAGPDADTMLAELREEFAPQVEAYARVLRNLHCKDAPIFGGLYYPRMRKFDWWEI